MLFFNVFDVIILFALRQVSDKTFEFDKNYFVL